jgi:hypothetical protein
MFEFISLSQPSCLVQCRLKVKNILKLEYYKKTRSSMLKTLDIFFPIDK